MGLVHHPVCVVRRNDRQVPEPDVLCRRFPRVRRAVDIESAGVDGVLERGPDVTAVIVEVDHGGEWSRVGRDVTPDVQPGSLSSETPDGGPRQVFMFGWFDGTGPAVWRSPRGVDIESGADRLVLASSGFEQVADLTEGPWELDQHLAGHVNRIRIRAASGSSTVIDGAETGNL